MSNSKDNSLWTKKGATLSDKTAQKEFGLTQEEIVDAIKVDKLEYRHNTLYGNPSLKLLRNQVEKLVIEKYGTDYLKTKQIKTELKKVNTEIQSLKRKISQLEKRKKELLKTLDE
jgi:DNA-directed RNA polymerase specialized sigma subunit